MKKWHKPIGWLTLALLFFVVGQGLAQTTDVPPEHWAYKAVQTLVERGYMDAGPGGQFNGTEPAQRYDVAAAVGRLLDDIESGRVMIGAGVDTDMLRALEQEFRAELVQWYSERDRLEAIHAQTQRHIGAIDEQLGRLLIALDDIEAALLAELTYGLQAEAERTDQRFSETEAELSRLDRRLEDTATSTTARLDALTAELDRRVGDLQHFVDLALGQYGEAVGAQFEEQFTSLGALRADVEALRSILTQHSDELDDLDLRLNNYITDQAAALAMRLEMTERNVQRLTDDLTSLSQVLTLAQRTTEEDVANLRSYTLEAVTSLNERVGRLEEQTAALLDGVAGMRSEMAALRQSMGQVQTELAELHDVLGTSEEQIARMTERVRMQLDDQLALALSRERQLERQLNDLRAEFDGYKAQVGEDMKSARNMGSMALGAAALAILFGLTK